MVGLAVDWRSVDWGGEGGGWAHFMRSSLFKKVELGDYGEKNRTIAFYSPGPVFNVKKNSCTTYCPPKKITHKSKKKKIMPYKIA